MSADLEQELREMFERASDWVTPRADLAGRVRAAAHRRRRALAVAVTIFALMCGVGYAAASWTGPHGRQGAASGHRAVNRHGRARRTGRLARCRCAGGGRVNGVRRDG